MPEHSGFEKRSNGRQEGASAVGQTPACPDASGQIRRHAA
jgi:hypothetical protein